MTVLSPELMAAIRGRYALPWRGIHAKGLIEADVTVQTCWDADRLDLGRVGIVPDPARLCTAAAKESAMRDWAFARSLRSDRCGEPFA
jgi:hypothetical protein